MMNCLFYPTTSAKMSAVVGVQEICSPARAVLLQHDPFGNARLSSALTRRHALRVHVFDLTGSVGISRRFTCSLTLWIHASVALTSTIPTIPSCLDNAADCHHSCTSRKWHGKSHQQSRGRYILRVKWRAHVCVQQSRL